MERNNVREASVLGISLLLGLLALGLIVSKSSITINRSERTVSVKGLSEREVPANIAIWPITFNEADNDLGNLYSSIEKKESLIIDFLHKSGFTDEEISKSSPAILDKVARQYSGDDNIKLRYSARTTITVYTDKVDLVVKTMNNLIELGKKNIAIAGEDYRAQTQFLFTRLNDLKPGMVQEATKNAREVAEKFAVDSQSKLGKIKDASAFSVDHANHL